MINNSNIGIKFILSYAKILNTLSHRLRGLRSGSQVQVQLNQVDPRHQKVQVVRRRLARAQSDHARSKNIKKHEKPQCSVTARRLPSQRHRLLGVWVRVKQPALNPREIPLRSLARANKKYHVSTDQGTGIYALKQRHTPGYQARKSVNFLK